MQTHKIEIVLQADQPIAHAEETLGSSSILMRADVRQPDGSLERVPIITGDAMRHGLREAAAYAWLDAAGLLGATLTEEALRLLFAGGMVTGTAGGSVKLGDYRQMCDVFPPLAILGGCAQNRVIEGRIMVDEALLICVETAHLMPAWVVEWASNGAATWQESRSLVEEVQRVRMDPSLSESKRTLLLDNHRAQIESRLDASEAASEVGEHCAKAASKSSMLPRRHERLVRGSLLFWRVTATTYSDLERDTLHVMLASFLADARVGGKRATGHGLLRPVAARNVGVRRPAERTEVLDLGQPGSEVGRLFAAHVAARKAEAAEFLAGVAA